MINPLRTPTARAATVWQSYALATASKADPSYLTFVRDRDALATIVYEIHAPVCGNLQRAIESPLVEIGYYLVNPDTRPVAETHEMITRTQVRFEQVEGFVAAGAGVAIEDGLRGVYVNGWRSLEVRSFVHALSPHSSLCIPIVSKKKLKPLFFFFRLTGALSFGHDR
jgi:hypothetical protein